jgi:hypothetical protein
LCVFANEFSNVSFLSLNVCHKAAWRILQGRLCITLHHTLDHTAAQAGMLPLHSHPEMIVRIPHYQRMAARPQNTVVSCRYGGIFIMSQTQAAQTCSLASTTLPDPYTYFVNGGFRHAGPIEAARKSLIHHIDDENRGLGKIIRMANRQACKAVSSGKLKSHMRMMP